jgi:hypothetical protein
MLKKRKLKSEKLLDLQKKKNDVFREIIFNNDLEKEGIQKKIVECVNLFDKFTGDI